MPYIKIANRMALDTIIDGLVKRLSQIDATQGDVNYTITRIVLETLNKDSYHSLSGCVAVLRDAADEIQRRLLGPYEDTAILKNGDMTCFQKEYAQKPLSVLGVIGDYYQSDFGVPHTPAEPAGHDQCCDPSQVEMDEGV